MDKQIAQVRRDIGERRYLGKKKKKRKMIANRKQVDKNDNQMSLFKKNIFYPLAYSVYNVMGMSLKDEIFTCLLKWK